MTIHSDIFGHLPDGRPVTRYVLTNAAGAGVSVLNYGATIQSFKTPDKHGALGDIVLGFDALDGYLGEHPYFGAVIGRVAGRIKNGTFRIDKTTFQVSQNENDHALHSGPEGFERQLWNAQIRDNALHLTHTSADGHQGYPGEVQVEIRLSLETDYLDLQFTAKTDAPTPLNLTHHSYFNLLADGRSVLDTHQLSIHAANYFPHGADVIPVDIAEPVHGTPYNHTHPCNPDIGLNHFFPVAGKGLREMAELSCLQSGRHMKIMSDEPGLVAYAAGGFQSMEGKTNQTYDRASGLAMEPQAIPTQLNILRPGEVYARRIQYHF